MDLPDRAVETISGTAWGAIWIITVVFMGSVIAYLTLYLRQLNKTILDLSEKRVREAREESDTARELEREALDAVNAAQVAIKELQKKVCDSDTKAEKRAEDTSRELQSFQVEIRNALNCRSCPGRALHGGGTT